MRRDFIGFVVALILAAAPAFAQKSSPTNASSKTRPGDHSNAIGNELGDKPESVIRVTKLKGKVSAIDLKERTVTINTDKDKEDSGVKLSFSQPQGREQIKVSKKAEKALGTKRIKFEELKVGSEVSLEYYPALGQMLELMVEETPAG